jgi:hypothetical protein
VAAPEVAVEEVAAAAAADSQPLRIIGRAEDADFRPPFLFKLLIHYPKPRLSRDFRKGFVLLQANPWCKSGLSWIGLWLSIL